MTIAEEFKNRKVGIEPVDFDKGDLVELARIFDENDITVGNWSGPKTALQWIKETIDENWEIMLFENGELNAYKNDPARTFIQNNRILTIREFINEAVPVPPVTIEDEEFMGVFK